MNKYEEQKYFQPDEPRPRKYLERILMALAMLLIYAIMQYFGIEVPTD